MIRPAKIVVCGAGFGEAWLTALRADPHRFAIAALLARGSATAVRTAVEHHACLVRSPDDVQENPDAAVVAVGGGDGADLAAAWLSRRVPVLIEHPVSARDIRRLHRAARVAEAPVHVNTHFADLEVCRRFLGRCRNLAAEAPTELLMAVATSRTLYSVLDMCLRAVDATEISVVSRLVAPPTAVFSLRAGATPVWLQVLPRLSACDDGADMLGGHRMTVCFPETQVSMEGPAGPIVDLAAPGQARYVWRVHAMERPTWRRYHLSMRTAAMRRSLGRLLTASRGRDSAEQGAERMQSLAVAWETIIRKLQIKNPASS